MKKLLITEEQLEQLKIYLNEENSIDDEEFSKTKERLFKIAVLSHKLWESVEEGKEMDDWMKSKIAQAEQSIINVVKSYMYGEEEHKPNGMDELDYDDLIIGN